MQWGPFGQFLDRGPEEDWRMAYSTVNFANIYGPSFGHSNAEQASTSAQVTGGKPLSLMNLSLPTLIVLGVLVWIALKEFD